MRMKRAAEATGAEQRAATLWDLADAQIEEATIDTFRELAAEREADPASLR